MAIVGLHATSDSRYSLLHCEQPRIFFIWYFSFGEEQRKRSGDDVPGPFPSDLSAIFESLDLWQPIAS